MKCAKFHVSNQTHMHQIVRYNRYTMSYMFRNFLSAIIRALNCPEIYRRLWIHCVHISANVSWFDTRNYASHTVRAILRLSMPNRQDWHIVLRTSGFPDGGNQEVLKQARDCILCSHFSVCKVGWWTEIYKVRLGYIWLDRDGRALKDIYQITKTRCNNIQRQPCKEKWEKKVI
jgi:hypothetical protein